MLYRRIYASLDLNELMEMIMESPLPNNPFHN